MKAEQWNKCLAALPEAAWLYEDECVVSSNSASRRLQNAATVPLAKIMEIALGEGCSLHSIKDECLHCPLEIKQDPTNFPLVLESKRGKLLRFRGSLTHLDESHRLLRLFPSEWAEKNEELVMNQLLIEYVNQAHEKERRSLARELHDGLAQSIYSLMLEVRGLKWLAAEELPAGLEKTDQHFVEVLKEVKELVTELRPRVLDDGGLLPAVAVLLKQLKERTMLTVTQTITGTPFKLSAAAETAVYRVIQEALNNILRHAAVQTATLAFDFEKNRLEVLIQDHGKGFDSEREPSGFGLKNMEERIQSVHGILSIQSARGKGTRILLEIPRQKGESHAIDAQ